MKISKTYTFDAAHQLVGHEGKCKNLHGHTYYVTVELEGEQVQNRAASDDTMVMDYGDLDKIVKPIIDTLDHAFLYGDVDSEGRLLLLVLDLNLRRCWVGTRSTAEEICFFIWNAVAYRMTAGTRLVVSVSETPKTSASYVGTVEGKLQNQIRGHCGCTLTEAGDENLPVYHGGNSVSENLSSVRNLRPNNSR